MTDLDEKIRKALAESGVDASDFDNESDDTLRTMIADAYQGKLRWMWVLATFWQLLFFVVFVYSGIEFFTMTTSEEPLFWATIFLMTGIGVAMMKIMHWMLINRNRILREIKRMELELARLGKRATRP